MKRKSIFIGLICCFGAVLTGVLLFVKSTSPMQKVKLSADYPKYDSLENLAEKADTVIKGKIITYKYSDLNVTSRGASDNEDLNPGGGADNSTIPYTVFNVEIEKTYKGNVKEKDTIQIKQLGGIIGKKEYVVEDTADFKLEKGKNYVFFLETYPDSPASLLNPVQGSYEYDKNDNIIYPKQDSNGEQNEIRFTMDDLDRIMKSTSKE